MSQETQSAPPKKARKTLWVAVAAVVLLGGGGGGAYWAFFAAPVVQAEPPAEPPAYLVLDPFVVNLSGSDARRFLRLTLGIVVEGEAHATEFNENAVTRMRVRSAILELLSQQSSEALITPEGKAALKATIADLISRNAEHLKISDVLFSEFIVQ
jgi:flagellar FliL protein